MKLLNERNWLLQPAKNQFHRAVRVRPFGVDSVHFHIQTQMKLSDIGIDLRIDLFSESYMIWFMTDIIWAI